jgi:pyruvate dehydrogenase E2 component (dihydrolipoamide acetyltransferase)
MAVEIKMPQLSDTMHAGKILTWNKREGEEIKRGDILAEVETDKANLEIESFQQGTLLKILVPADQMATVGDVIAVIGQPGEAYNGPQAAQSEPATPLPEAEAPVTAGPPQNREPQTPAIAAPRVEEDTSRSGRIKASPLARKIAEQSHIDLAKVHGTGPNGRIVRRDVEAVQSGEDDRPVTPPAPQPVTSPAPQAAPPSSTRAPSQPGQGRLTPLSKMRDTIARRMQESVVQAPHFYTTASIDMEDAVKLRERLKGRPEYKGISVNHFIIKAAAYALERERRVNNAVRDGMLYEPDQISIGIVTAIEDGLLIPVIHGTNTLSLKDLVFEARAAVERARAGRPTSSDLMGGTFSISNMGMYDIESFTAIINPGQGAILAVSSVQEVPVVKKGQVVVGSRMKVTLSVDHRIIDGVMAGNFLKHFKEALETPALLLA